MDYSEILIKSSLDGSKQPSLFIRSPINGRRPLLVGLHTWSYDRFNQLDNMGPLVEEYGFHLLLPEFRGPSLVSNPNCSSACGSELAKRDIKDAVDYIIEKEDVDRDNIFLLGASGGGHMSLLMAGYCPEYFKAVAAFVPITDLRVWAGENPKYRPHIMTGCNEDPKEMFKRSPVAYMDKISQCNVKIFHGKYDPVVPMGQSMRFYNEMLEKYPNARIYLDIFDGGHQMDKAQAMYWFMSQYKKSFSQQVTG